MMLSLMFSKVKIYAIIHDYKINFIKIQIQFEPILNIYKFDFWVVFTFSNLG